MGQTVQCSFTRVDVVCRAPSFQCTRGLCLVVQAGGRGLEDAAGGQPHADFVSSAACKLSQLVANSICCAVFVLSDASGDQDMMPQP